MTEDALFPPTLLSELEDANNLPPAGSTRHCAPGENGPPSGDDVQCPPPPPPAPPAAPPARKIMDCVPDPPESAAPPPPSFQPSTWYDESTILVTGSPATTSCADKTTEVVFSAYVAGCDGGWSVPGIANAGTLCNGEGGWHLCTGEPEIASLGVSNCLTDALSNGHDLAARSPIFYTTLETSRGTGSCRDDDPTNYGTNDIWGCGVGHGGPSGIQPCGALNAGTGGARRKTLNWGDWAGLIPPGNNEVATVYKTGNNNGGAMCCAEPASACVTWCEEEAEKHCAVRAALLLGDDVRCGFDANKAQCVIFAAHNLTAHLVDGASGQSVTPNTCQLSDPDLELCR